MAEGEIPAGAIDRHTWGWSYEDAYLFERCMRAMDEVYRHRNDDPAPEASPVSVRDAFRGATSGKGGRRP